MDISISSYAQSLQSYYGNLRAKDKYSPDELEQAVEKSDKRASHYSRGDDDDAVRHAKEGNKSEQGDTFRSVRHEEMDRFRMEMKALRNEYKEEFKAEKEGLVEELRAEGADKRVIRQEVRALRDEFRDDFKELRGERKEALQESLNGLGEDIRELRQQFREDFREAKNDLREEAGESGDRDGLGDAIRELRKEFREDFFEARQERIDAFRDDNGVVVPPTDDGTPPADGDTPPVDDGTPPVDDGGVPVNGGGTEIIPNSEITASQVAHSALSSSENIVADMEVMVSDASDGGSFNSDQFEQLQKQLQQDLQTYQSFVDDRVSAGGAESNEVYAQLEELGAFSDNLVTGGGSYSDALEVLDSAGGILSQELNLYGSAEDLAATYAQTVNTSSGSTAATDPVENNIILDAESALNLVNSISQQLVAGNEQVVLSQANLSSEQASSLLNQ